LPAGQWIHFDIAATPGKAEDDKWTMKVTLPGQAVKEFAGLAFGNPKFRKLTWMGFSSNANAATVWYLDNFAVEGGTR